MDMQKLFKRINDRSGMTLLEILISLALLGLIVMAVFPLITQSLSATNSANTIASAIFANQKDFEIVATTEEGAYLHDGIIIPAKNFPNVFNTSNPVAGMTVKKGTLIRFLATSIASGVLPSTYFPMEVYEGYTSAESVFKIKDDSFSSSSVVDLGGASGITVDKSVSGQITFTLSTTNRLTNEGGDGEGNYIITITTGTGTNAVVKNAVVIVHLPRAVIAKSDKSLLIASSTNPDSGNWVSKTSGSITGNIKKIVFNGAGDEQSAAFIAIDDAGMIYSWANGGSVFTNVYNAGDTSISLNDIIVTNDGMLVVGDNGLIVKSADGINWTVIRGPSTAAGYYNLNAITYYNGKYYCASDGRVVVVYNSTAGTWDQLIQPVLYPRLVTNDINSKSDIEFSGSESLTSNYNPVSSNNARTIFMVVKPTASPSNKVLFSMGTASNYLTIRTDGNGRLVVKTQYQTYSPSSSSPQLVNGTASIISCRIGDPYLDWSWDDWSFHYYNDVLLTVNNSSNNAYSDAIRMDTGNSSNPVYLGSDSLTGNSGSNFIGKIAEVLVFDSALDNTETNTFTAKSGKTTKTYTIASYMDIVNYYLHLKYNIPLATSIDSYYYGPTVSNKTNLSSLPPTSPPYLSIIPWATWQTNCWPYNTSNGYSMTPPMWADASTFGSLDTTLIQSIYKLNKWERITYSNPLGIDATKYFYDNSSGNALQAIASDNNGVMYSGGYKRAMVTCANLNASSPSLVVDTSALSTDVSGYSMEDMVNADSQFVTVLNSDTAGKIYSFTAGGTGTLSTATYPILNDLFCYDPDPTISNNESLLVVGNSGTILYSSDGSNWTNKSVSSTGNLLAGCLR